jgi:hypothetical protein
MEPLGGERHRWESREVEMLGRHESMRATSEFSTRSTSKPQPIGHTIKIAPHCRIVCVRPHGVSQNRPTIIGLSSSLALYCRLCQPHCCSPRRSCSDAGPPMPLATRGSIVSRQLPLCSTATSRLYRPCRSPSRSILASTLVALPSISRVPRRSILSFYFSLSEIRLLSRPGFAAVIRPLFNQFLGRHRVKGNNCPIGFSVYGWTVPDVRRD